MPARIILNDVAITVHENRFGNVSRDLGCSGGNQLFEVDVLEVVLHHEIHNLCVLSVDSLQDFVKLREMLCSCQTPRVALQLMLMLEHYAPRLLAVHVHFRISAEFSRRL